MAPTREDDQLGRVCLVTGGTSGIGLEIARGLALKRAHVVIASHNAQRGRQVAEELGDDAANPHVESLEVDLASQRSLRQAAAHFRKRFDKLHVLVHAAAVHLPVREVTAEGVERTWAINVLARYLLSTLLLDTLAASAPARVVHVACALAGGLDLDDVQLERRPYDGLTAYRRSKQADRMLAWALAERVRDKGVTVNAAHPGVVRTGLLRARSAGWLYAVGAPLARSAARGADSAVWLAASRALTGDTGGYYVDRKEKHCPYRDEDALDRLWTLCEAMTRSPSTQGGR